MTWIRTISGRRVDLNPPKAEQIDLYDIAHALSQICRFNGHTMRHYSVAEHQVLVARLLPPPLQLAGLFHDSPEAYLGDVVR
ncbi:MAG: phosphohydrolase, partial [Planctomyces sp.]|nr:phosphohydrolase [Planctomyces sp.]